MIDELADVSPEDFVAARDALAKELKAAGKVAEAAEIKKLRKPTVQAWIAEQVRRHHDDAVDDLRQASSAVAAAQEQAITSGDRDALKAATTKRREAIRELGRAVEQVLARNGRPASHKDDVLSELEAEITAEVAGGTFGLRDDLELPAPRKPAKPKPDPEVERRKALAKQEISAARERVRAAREALADAESDLSAVLERHRGIESDA